MINLAAGPANLDVVGFVALRETESQNKLAGRQVAGAAAQHLRLRITAGREPHNGADPVAKGGDTTPTPGPDRSITPIIPQSIRHGSGLITRFPS